jgi:PRC-barrel domain
MAVVEMWTFAVDNPNLDLSRVDLAGFEVEARDGSIGKVDEATYEAGGSFVVIDTGPWIFGKKVMLPAGVVRDVDLEQEAIQVDLTKEQIKNAPEFDMDRYRDESYRSELGSYYSQEGGSENRF